MRNIFKHIITVAAVLSATSALAQTTSPQQPVELNENGVHIKVIPSYTPETQSGTLRIESFVEGNVEVVTELPPLDVLFVVGNHGSMNCDIDGQTFYTVLNNLVTGEGGFVDQLMAKENTSAPDPDVKFGLISFTNGGKVEEFSTEGFVDRTTFESKMPTGASGNIDVSGKGIQLAKDFFEAYHKDSSRMPVVIYITDGNKDMKQCGLVEGAYDLKKGGALFASILLLEKNGKDEPNRGRMEWASSNYPDAKAENNLGSKLNDKYYKNTNSITELASFFSGLAQEIKKGGATVELTEKSYLAASTTPSFAIPGGATSVRTKAADVISITGPEDNRQFTFGDDYVLTDASVEIKDGKLTVSGYEYAVKFCGFDDDEVHGSKLIIEIDYQLVATPVPIVPIVKVFDDESGLFAEDGTRVIEFPSVSISLPAIQVTKAGLKSGETALFKLTDKDGKEVATFVMKGAGEDKPSITKVIIPKLIPGVNYTVTELTDWRFAYEAITTKSITKELVNATEEAPFNIFEFGTATAKTDLPLNAEDGKLNVLEPGEPASGASTAGLKLYNGSAL